MFSIGPHRIDGQAVLAPMAGVSDMPQRELCSALGAAYTVGEMITSDKRLWQSRKTRQRLTWGNCSGPRVVQIAGAEPGQLGAAAKACESLGAQIIDINMGCPAKKVCSKAAGSALLRDEKLVAAILHQVVNAVNTPVTVKIRTGWDTDTKNALTIARIAEDLGIAALTVHGRTRACRFKGFAEYDTIAEVVNAVSIPVIANGDIDSAKKAADVLSHTQAAAVMIGRAAQGNPWIFNAVNQYLRDGTQARTPSHSEFDSIVCQHLRQIHEFYGDYLGVRIARKHLGWYLSSYLGKQPCPTAEAMRQHFNTLTTLQEQLLAVNNFFARLQQPEDHAA